MSGHQTQQKRNSKSTPTSESRNLPSRHLKAPTYEYNKRLCTYQPHSPRGILIWYTAGFSCRHRPSGAASRLPTSSTPFPWAPGAPSRSPPCPPNPTGRMAWTTSANSTKTSLKTRRPKRPKAMLCQQLHEGYGGPGSIPLCSSAKHTHARGSTVYFSLPFQFFEYAPSNTKKQQQQQKAQGRDTSFASRLSLSAPLFLTQATQNGP